MVPDGTAPQNPKTPPEEKVNDVIKKLMGGILGKNKYEKMRGDAKVGSATECPMCGEIFSKSTSYNDVSQESG